MVHEEWAKSLQECLQGLDRNWSRNFGLFVKVIFSWRYTLRARLIKIRPKLEILEDDNIVKIINYTTTFRHIFPRALRI